MTARIVGLDRLEEQLARFNRRELPRKMQEFTTVVALSGFRQGVLSTPVDTGRLRGGWAVGIAGPGNESQTRKDPSGGNTISEGTGVILGARPYSSIWMTNAVRYAPIVDQGGFVPKNPGASSDPRPGREGRVLVSGGYSVQAPQGMTDGMVRVMRASVNRAIAAARRVR